MAAKTSRNVLGGPLETCCTKPMTGWFRNGRCDTEPADVGRHVVCVHATEEFLEFSRRVGNDLSTPRPEFAFPGVKPGDRWCVCAARWLEAYEAGVAAPVILAATEESALEVIPLEALKSHALDLAS